MKNTKIEWAHHTFNPWIGCTKVSPACDHCYAENLMASRMHVVQWGAGQPRKRTSAANWNQPLRWNAKAERLGIRYRVFCASLADVFDNEIPEHWRWDLFRLIHATPHLDWLLLTKRIGNAREMMNEAASAVDGDFVGAQCWDLSPWTNVWLGATVCNQAEADRDIPKLLATPARVRFLSIEPLLGPVNLDAHLLQCCEQFEYCDYGSYGHRPECCGQPVPRAALDWIIVGGESGPGARPMHPDWVRSLRNQCARAEVPFLFKQWGEWLPWHHFASARLDDPPEQTRFDTREWFDGAWNDVGKPGYWEAMDGAIDDMRCVGRVGKKRAGRLLDGRTWDEVPA